MSKVYLRRCEVYTVKRCSEPVEIDVEKLRKCSPPYEGESTSQLMEYLEENVFVNDEWYERNKDIYPDYQITGEEMDIETEYFDSRIKGCNEWLEIGNPNEKCTKNGFFETLESND
jgi:hypothetical protein